MYVGIYSWCSLYKEWGGERLDLGQHLLSVADTVVHREDHVSGPHFFILCADFRIIETGMRHLSHNGVPFKCSK